MNKAELIDAMAADANLTKADAKKALDAFIKVTTNALSSGDKLALVGFGSFSVSTRAGSNQEQNWRIRYPKDNLTF